MSRHVQREPQISNMGLFVLALIMVTVIGLCIVATVQSVESRQVPVQEQTAKLTAPQVSIGYDTPQVTTTAAPPAPAPVPTFPIPPCANSAVGPGTPPCHWDSGQYGGAESFVWTGEYKIPLIEPRP